MNIKNKLTSIMLLVILGLIATQFNTYAEQKRIVLGDLNNDSKVNLEDSMISLKGAVGILTLDKEQEKVADVNADGKINLQDAVIILKRAVGIDVSNELRYHSIEELANSDMTQEIVDKVNDENDSVLKMAIKADNNVLIYEYYYTYWYWEDIPADVGSSLYDGLVEQRAACERLIESLRITTNEKNPVVRIAYYSADGLLITSRDFH